MVRVVSVVALLGLAAASSDGPAAICSDAHGQLTAVRGVCPASHPTSVRFAGVNIFDILWNTSPGQDTCCNKTGGPATFADAVRALESAQAGGVKVFRFFASLWGPWQKYWAENEEAHFADLDKLFDEIERLGMYAIPSIGTGDWHLVANAVVPGLQESQNDLVMNSTSASRGLANKYFDQLVSRYVSREAVLFWELGNELNLKVNLRPEACGPSDKVAAAEQCFNTAQMTAYTQDLAAKIRAIDSRRPISSGFSVPRPSAWHNEHCPLQGACDADKAGYWGTDSVEQWSEMLGRQHEGLDIWSIHHYEGDTCFFGHDSDCVTSAYVATIAARAALAKGKVLYVGEYGARGPNFTGPSEADQAWPAAMLDAQVADEGGAFLLSSIWAWECPSHRSDMVCIWPGSERGDESGSDRMASLLRSANAKLAGADLEVLL